MKTPNCSHGFVERAPNLQSEELGLSSATTFYQLCNHQWAVKVSEPSVSLDVKEILILGIETYSIPLNVSG